MTSHAQKNRPSDGFARPSLPAFDALDSEHRAVLEALGQLRRLIDALDREGITDETRQAARQISRFFSENAREHHAAEERLVFPTLLKSTNAELVRNVVRLQQDHGWLEEDWLELQPQLEAIANGYNWYDLEMLRHALPVFEQLYRDHIALEESMIYPEARRRQAMADDAVKQRLSQASPSKDG
jgi:hemerythrin-like domain-containing protein